MGKTTNEKINLLCNPLLKLQIYSARKLAFKLSTNTLQDWGELLFHIWK